MQALDMPVVSFKSANHGAHTLDTLEKHTYVGP